MGLNVAGFNFLSHGSQDLYPTYLRDAKLFTDHDATIATIIGNCVSRVPAWPSVRLFYVRAPF